MSPSVRAKPRRVFVRGTTGSGKTTLAKRLAEKLGVECVELDALHHMPGWTERPRDELVALVQAATKRDGWVIDGNYGFATNDLLTRADIVVWLDYSFMTVFLRLLGRTVRRALKRQELWAGNRESLFRAFFTRKSILWWMVTTHFRRRRQCNEARVALQGSGTEFVHLLSPLATEIWLVSIE